MLQGRYRVGAAFGFGGMGSVFLAIEEPSGKPRVVKQLRLSEPELLEAFRGEFALLSTLTHPHLLRVLDFGSERIRGEPTHYYVAERVEGVALSQHAREASSAASLLRPLLDALEGLSALHDAGIRHGDFTPANVLVDQSGAGTLIDLGCAEPFGASHTVSGTEGFIAPEVLAGQPSDARADLFSLGKTLTRVFGLSKLAPPAEVKRLIERLVRDDVRARPVDVREVLEAFRRKPKPGQRQVQPHRLLGRAEQIACFEDWLRQFGRDRSAPPLVTVSGLPGSGVSRLVRELVWRSELELSVRRARTHDSGSVSRLLAEALGVAEPIHSLRGVLAAVNVLSERAEPMLLVFEDHEKLERDERELLLALLRSLRPGSNLAVLVAGRSAPIAHAACAIACGPLGQSDVQAWVGESLSARQLEWLMASSGGLPREIEAASRELGSAKGTPATGRAPSARVHEAIAALEAAPRALLARLIASADDGNAHADTGQGDEAALAILTDVRLVRREEDRFIVTADARAAASSVAPLQQGVAQAHRYLAEQALELEPLVSPVAVARLLFHLTAGGELLQAEQLFLEQKGRLCGASRATVLRLQSLFGSSRNAQLLLEGARLTLSAKLPRLAVRHAARAAHIDPLLNLEATVLVADCLLRLGKPKRVERLLTAPRSQFGEEPQILDRLARARLARGAYREALQAAEHSLLIATTPASQASAHEVLGIACSYLGDLERAQAELRLALAGLGSTAAGRDLYRIRSHSALVAFRMGQIDAALSEYAAALGLAEEHELDDLLAMALLNLGTAEQQAGQWGSALRRYERGLAFARASARTDTELTLEYNLANLYADIGAFERAEESLVRLRARVDAQGLRHFVPAIRLLCAELLLLREQPGEARSLLEEAEGELSQSGQPRELLEVRLRLVDAELALGKLIEAKARLRLLRAELEASGSRDLELSFQLGSARVAVAAGDRSAIAQLEALNLDVQRERLLALEATVAGELAVACGRFDAVDLAAAHTERARRSWDRIAFDLPSALGAIFWRHPRRSRLAELSKSLPAPNAGESAALRRILALNRRLNSPHSLDRVLDYALQASVDLTLAERGFLVLCEPSTDPGSTGLSLIVRASSDADTVSQRPSQSILRRTVDRQEAVLTTDAAADPRFAAQGSVHALQIKSVLCVPIAAATGTLGAIYLDSRVQNRRFTDTDRDLLLAFADQVAVAIANKRLLQEVERQRAELERQKLELEQAARGQVQEVERLRREVQTQKQTLELRYDYAQIVGRGPAMRRLLERLDRVTDSPINVLILGESGTGKELVARAIHWNGPRKAGPFLGINCAALPESLLESELFGHVRGAFTGADRDKLGLLQAAGGGTLFLDEIGELPLSTQAKLLRVLQEREVRPLGATASVQLDIRLLAATHRDLARDVAAGTFREDLFYRIAVVTVQVPPLRERLEDLPLLSQRILEGLARDAGRPRLVLGQEALRKLSMHPFRGNVRELQNVLTRAFVLSTTNRLRAEDIELGTSALAAQRTGSRQEFQSQERERILEALHSARWNVSAVAQTLGMPRVTLHRKLKRYGIKRDSEPNTSR